jgi:2-dehydro-3-deoxygalactonokinase
LRPFARFPDVAAQSHEVPISPAPHSSDGCALVGVDWGTSNVRVMRIAEDGSILEARSDPRGADELASDAFADVLEDIAGDWLGAAPVLICGMAGARGRWRETSYAPCPARLADLASMLVRPDSARNIHIVPGVAELAQERLSDVMRGEETQVMGLAEPDAAEWVVAPGTHSKWIRVENEQISSFRTFATGELFAALRGGTLMAAGTDEEAGDDDAFKRGVERSLEDPALSAALFSARVAVLDGRLSAQAAPDYVSGVLIGAEIGAQRQLLERERVALVGAEDLARRYNLALEVAGHPAGRTCDPIAAVARGLWRIWRSRP